MIRKDILRAEGITPGIKRVFVRGIQRDNPKRWVPPEGYPKTWLDVARERGVVVRKDGSITADAFWEVGIALLNGCPTCHATVAPYNSYQMETDAEYAVCRGCAGMND